MRRGGIDFFFVRDVLGNIVEVIRGTDGVTVAAYRYDAWGNTTVLINIDNMAHINPWRYRGKYTDRATGFIYMQTRYYDPVVRRFINPDNYMLLPLLAMTGELNMQTYALQNPIRYKDPTGQVVILLTLLTFAVVGGIVGGVVAHQNDQNVFAGILMGAGAGLILGGLTIATGGAFLAKKGAIMPAFVGAAKKSAAVKKVGTATKISRASKAFKVMNAKIANATKTMSTTSPLFMQAAFKQTVGIGILAFNAGVGAYSIGRNIHSAQETQTIPSASGLGTIGIVPIFQHLA